MEVVNMSNGLSKWDNFKIDIDFMFPIRQIFELKAYLKNILFRRHHIIRTRLPKGQWYDTDTRMLYGMMNLLMEFLEKEKPFETTDFDSSPTWKSIKKEIITIKDWWLNYETRKVEFTITLNKWQVSKFGNCKGEECLHRINEPDTKESKELFDKLAILETKLEREEAQMLMRLVKIRKYLWT